MSAGCYGPLESVIPPVTVPAWMCMATSQDPGSLGVYGFRNRIDHSYQGLGLVTSKSIHELALWDYLALEGRRSVVIGVPPGYPPRRVNGVFVGCFITPDSSKNVFTHPPEIQKEIERVVGGYPVDVKGFRTNDKDWLRDQIYEMSRKHFQVVRHFLANTPWDYFQFVEIGLDRMHHGFWKFHDPAHVLHEAGHRHQHVIRDYYRYLDEEVGTLLELIDSDTAVLVVSDHGAQRLDGGFCVNEWLVREGLLVLDRYPDKVSRFEELAIDWSRTVCWSEGGYYARVFLNVQGREPQGIITPADYEKVRNDLKARFEGTRGPDGRPLGTVAYKPQDIYRHVRNVAPDLIVHFGDLYWRSIGGVGYPSIHVQENDTGPDDCNHAQFGSFILAAPGIPPRGRLEGASGDAGPELSEPGDSRGWRAFLERRADREGPAERPRIHLIRPAS
jgi:predicted AlkP superfamily phosphohydrolase/phosphomutase